MSSVLFLVLVVPRLAHVTCSIASLPLRLSSSVPTEHLITLQLVVGHVNGCLGLDVCRILVCSHGMEINRQDDINETPGESGSVGPLGEVLGRITSGGEVNFDGFIVSIKKKSVSLA